MSLSIPPYVDGNALTRGRFPNGDTALAMPRPSSAAKMHGWRRGDSAVFGSNDVRQHQQNHHHQRHSKQPKNDRHNHTPTSLHQGSIAFPDNARPVTKFHRDEASGIVPASRKAKGPANGLFDDGVRAVSAHMRSGITASGPALVIAICRIAFGLLHVAPRRTRRWSNPAAVPFDADALVLRMQFKDPHATMDTRRWTCSEFFQSKERTASGRFVPKERPDREFARAPARGSVRGLARQGRTFDLRVTLTILAIDRSIPACATTACNT